MSNALQTASPEKILAQIKKLFGPPPVLTSESLKDYDNIMLRFIECLMPRDGIEDMFVADLTDLTWEARRYSLHKTLLIEREFLRQQEIEHKRRRHEQKCKAERDHHLAEKRKTSKESVKGETAEPGDQQGEQVAAADEVRQAGGPTTLFERMVELEEVVDLTVSDVDEILLAPADEQDHAAALEASIDYFERLERLLSVAIARRNDALRQIDFHRQGLARRVSDNIIEGEFSETKHEAPSIAGPDDDEDAQ